jgi:hypothetical protein
VAVADDAEDAFFSLLGKHRQGVVVAVGEGGTSRDTPCAR